MTMDTSSQGGDSTNDRRRQTLIDHTMFFGLDNHKRNSLGIKNEPGLCHKVIQTKKENTHSDERRENGAEMGLSGRDRIVKTKAYLDKFLQKSEQAVGHRESLLRMESRC